MTYFILSLIAVILLCVVFVEHYDRPSHWPIVFLAVLCVANYWTSWFTYPKFEVEAILMYAGTYLVVGAIWSIFKWYRFCVAKYKQIVINNSFWPAADKPQASYHKFEISVWISWWPFSMLNYAILSLAKDLINFIIDQLAGVYNSISDSIFKDLEEKAKIEAANKVK